MISTSLKQIVVWVKSFSVCAHLDIAMEHMYGEAEEKYHLLHRDGVCSADSRTAAVQH